MSDNLTPSSVRSIEKVLRDNAAGKQDQLSIEVLQNLIRQSLAEFVNANYPLLDVKVVNNAVHSAVSVKSAFLEVNTIDIAGEIVRVSSENREQLMKELSKNLVALAKRVVGRFLHYSELKKYGTNIAAKDFLINAGGQFTLSAEDLQNVLSRYKQGGEGIVEVLRVSLQGRAWQVKLIGYQDSESAEQIKKKKMLAKIKQKLAKVKSLVAKKLMKMAEFIKKAGANSKVGMEIKPFLKGAKEKLQFVLALGDQAFERLAEQDLSDMAAQNLLQTLDSELGSLLRYVEKVEKIFDKLKKDLADDIELPITSGLILSEEDELFLKESPVEPSDDFQALILEKITGQGDAEDEMLINKNFDNSISWKIKRNGQAQEDVPGIELKKKGFFTKLFSRFLSLDKYFKEDPFASSSAGQVNLMLNDEPKNRVPQKIQNKMNRV